MEVADKPEAGTRQRAGSAPTWRGRAGCRTVRVVLAVTLVAALAIGWVRARLALVDAALMDAVGRGDELRVSELLCSGADAQVKDAPPLSAYETCARMLARAAGSRGRTTGDWDLLMVAVYHDRARIAAMLLAHGAEPTSRDRD